jgi:hypothetical protein
MATADLSMIPGGLPPASASARSRQDGGIGSGADKYALAIAAVPYPAHLAPQPSNTRARIFRPAGRDNAPRTELSASRILQEADLSP